MKSVVLTFVTMVALVLGRLGVQGQSLTTFYQPTPYPNKRFDGSVMPENIKIAHVWGGWFNNSTDKMMVRDAKLQIGGVGNNTHISPIKFDLTGLPANADQIALWLYALPSGSACPSQVSLWRISSDWIPSTFGWDRFPSVDLNGYYWPITTSVNNFRGYIINGWYNDWKSGAYPNNGILIWPYLAGGAQCFDRFASSRATASRIGTDLSTRPILGFYFVPTLQLKMPLPGNHSWLVTTEIGGYDCKGKYDSAHDDIISSSTGQPLNNYFSIDFSSRNIADVGATIFNSTNIPVIAASGGKVVEVGGGNNIGDFNGFYIIIDHDMDGKKLTGFSTRYLHLKQNPARTNGVALAIGNDINPGEQIGIMGSTGKDSNGNPTSTGVHLHFGVRYNDSGAKTVPELAKVIMEGMLLKNFQTECSLNSSGIPTDWNRHYRSGNRVY